MDTVTKICEVCQIEEAELNAFEDDYLKDPEDNLVCWDCCISTWAVKRGEN